MIEKHELRLLNWVKNKETGKFHRIIRLDEYSSPLDRIEPIELTEDILLKCAEIKKETFYFGKEALGESYNVKDSNLKFRWVVLDSVQKTYGFELLVNRSVIVQHVKYLHQAQNIINSITGKELQIDLK